MRIDSTAIQQWLQQQWVYAATLCGVFLLCLLPAVGHAWTLPLVLTYLQLPIYIVHQMEEHYGDRFRHWVNETVAGGREALSLEAVFVINAGVWVTDLTALYLALFVDAGFGAIAGYLPVVNAVSHIGGAVSMGRYNPGLYSSVVLFLPLGIWTILECAGASQNPILSHVVGLGSAILIHIAIIIHVKVRLSRLSSGASGGNRGLRGLG